MKLFVTALALVTVAMAAPSDIKARTFPEHQPAHQGGVCNVNGDNNGKVTCCNSGIPILGSLLCNVLAIGNTCDSNQGVYCCKSGSDIGLINVDLLNCVNVLN